MSEKCLQYKTEKLRYLGKLRLSESDQAPARNIFQFHNDISKCLLRKVKAVVIVGKDGTEATKALRLAMVDLGRPLSKTSGMRKFQQV